MVQDRLGATVYKPEYASPVRTAIPGPNGSVWVNIVDDRLVSEPGKWWVVDESGRVVSVVELPGLQEVRYAASGFVLGFVEDDLGVFRLTRYRIDGE